MRSRRPAIGVLLVLAGCLSDRVVTPDEPLPAVIAVDKPGIQFVSFALGRRVPADTIRVGNNGEAELGVVSVDPGIQYAASGRSGWLRATVVDQSASGALVVLEPEYLEEAGSPPDTARVLIRASGASQGRFVQVVARTLPGAHYEFSTNPVTFATVPGGPPSLTQVFTTRNGGNGELPIHPPRIRYLGPVADWLAVSLEPGSPAAAPSFALQASPEGLPSGLHQAWIVFEAPLDDPVRARPDSFPAQLRIGEPRLAASATVVSFVTIRGGAAPAPEVITLGNTGEGTFSSLGPLTLEPIVYPTGPDSWLTADLVDGVVTLAATTAALPEGTFSATVPVGSRHGGRVLLTATVEVRLPGLTLSTRTVSFNAVERGAGPGPRAVEISNSGSGTLATLGALSIDPVRYPAGSPGGWLAAALVDSTVTLTPSLGSLAAGIYQASVGIGSEHGGRDSVVATFTVARATDPPALTLATDAVGFSGIRGDPDPAAQTIQITNAGGGTLGALAVAPVAVPWLSAAISGGNLELRARTGTLPAGTQTATVTVTAQNAPSATVKVTFTVGLPQLTLSATTAAFSATVAAAAAPANRAITASNSGAGTVSSLGPLTLGTVSYGPGQPTGWLTAIVTGATITVSAATGGLGADLYVATVPVISATGGTVPITVTFTVSPPAIQPELALSRAAVSFAAVAGGANPAPQIVTFYNSGGGVDADLGAVTATIPPGATWLGRTVASGAVTFTATTGGLAPGSYSATVPIVSAEGGSSAVAIAFTVADPGLPPRLALSTTSIGLATTEGAATLGSRTISVSNTGGGSLGTVSLGAPSYSGTSSGWLALPTIAGGTITITPATAGLPAGSSTATFTASTAGTVAGSPVTITVGLTVADSADTTTAARLTLSSRQLSFAADSGDNPAAQTIDVDNTGTGSLGAIALGATGYGSGAGGWLTRTYSALTGRITVDVESDALDPGSYSATFTVSAAGATTGSPAVVTVRLTVEPVAPAPALELSTTAVSFAATEGSNPAGSETITIRNAGGGTLGTPSLGTVSYGPGATGWLGRTIGGGVVTLTATTAALAPGIYTGTFAVSASGSSRTVTVTATVAPEQQPPRLTLSARSIGFATQAQATALPQTVTVTNTGGGNFASLGAIAVGPVAFAGSTGGWLTAAIAGGTITLTPATAALAPATYTATVPVTSGGGGSSAIAVSLTVAANNAPPSLQVSLASLTFGAALGGATPPPQTITVTNAGGGTLAGVAIGAVTFGSGQPTQWLSTPAAGAGVTGSSITFSVDPAGLGAGIYTASVPITSANGGGKTVGVTLTVEAPVLTLSTRTVSFDATQETTAPAPQTITLRNTGIGTFANLGAISLGPVSYGTQEPFGWLAAQLGSERVTLQASIAGLPQGTFTARLPVISQFGGSVILVITYTVAPGAAPPVLALSSDLVVFNGTLGGADPLPQTVSISNLGGQTLGALGIGPVPADAGWLEASLAGNQARFSIRLAGLAAGDYSATVPITSANAGSEPVTVSLKVGAPKLALSVATVTFGDTVASPRTLTADVFLTNGGAGDLAALGALRIGAVRYAAGEPAGWLVAPAAETMLTNPIVGLAARVTGLPARRYHAEVDVGSARGGDATIAVTLAVNQPDPSFDRPSIDFAQDGLSVDSVFKTVAAGDTTQSAIRLQIRNPNETAIGLSGLRVGTPVYSGAGGWIAGAFLDKTSAPFGAPAELLIAVDPRGLAPGRHLAEIEISASGAKNSPRRLVVVLIVE